MDVEITALPVGAGTALVSAVTSAAAAGAPRHSGRPAPLRQPWLPRRITWHGTTLGGGQVAAAVAMVADVLARNGVNERSSVTLESDDTGRTLLAFLALACRGARLTLISPSAGPCDLAEDATHAIVLRDAKPGEIDLRLVIRSIEREAPAEGTAGLDVPMRIAAWLGRSDVLAIRSSGTTTGAPTLIWKNGADLVENALATARSVGYTSDDVFLPLLPLSGQYGSSVMIIATVLGAGIAFSNRTKVAETLRMIARAEVTAVDAVPLVYRRMLDEIAGDPHHGPRVAGVRVFGVGGEGLSAALDDEFHRVTGRRLLNGYGLAQIGNVGFCEGIGSVDGFSLVDTFGACAMDESGRAVEEGAVGRVRLFRLDGRSLGGSRWLDTGDIGIVRGRSVEVAGREGAVNRNGTVIHLAWVERELAKHSILAVAVEEENSVRHRYWLMISDRLRRPMNHWRRRVEEILGAELAPDRIQVMSAMPQDSSGKVSRSRLKHFAARMGTTRHGGNAAASTPAGALRQAARAARAELTELIAEVSDVATAVRDMRSMLTVLDHAEAELALHSTPPPLPVDVFMTRNAILESFAVYCLIPALWASEVNVRPATGTEHIVRRLQEIFGSIVPSNLRMVDSSQEAFVASIAERPSVVLFTGRRPNAESVLRRIGRRHLFLFFGRGVNPVVAGANADVEAVARETIAARLYNGGQDCLAPDLILAHVSVVENLTDALRRAIAAHMRACRGRMASLVRTDTVLDAVRYLLEHSSGIVTGGGIDYVNRRIEPTIVRISPEHALDPVEHFAPILPVLPFADDADAYRLLSSERHRELGFGVSLYGWDETYAYRLSDHFMVATDQSLSDAVPPFEAFGGHGAESGFVVEAARKRFGPINITQRVAESRLAFQEAVR